MTCRLTVRVQPRAGRDAIEGFDDAGVLRLRVTAPPADGRANERVLALLAGALGVPRTSLTLVSGQRSRTKLVDVPFDSVEEVRARLSSGR